MERDTLRKGYIYVVAHPNMPGHCKVGVTANLRRRLHGYQTGCPDRAFYYAYWWEVSDTFLAEHLAFRELRGARVKNTEWFRLHPEDAGALIASRIGILRPYGYARQGDDGAASEGKVRDSAPSGDE